MSLSQKIIDAAHFHGFDRAAILPAEALSSSRQALTQWLAEGRHGELDYMARHQELRLDAAVLEPGTRSVLVVLKSYYQPLDLLPGGARISRYAQGDDYHEVLRARLKSLAQSLEQDLGVEVNARPAVDSAPLLERAQAQGAGLGWIGKNTMLIHPTIGSFFFIAELLLSLKLEPIIEPPTPDRCGSCSRCLDQCPTGALVAPRVLDARRCISYLTIELRGPIPRHLRPLIEDYLFGCDLCQDVCPWNRKVTASDDEAFSTREAYLGLSPEVILSMDQMQFSSTFARSPIKRTKRRGLLRNAAVVIGNRAELDAQTLELLFDRLEHEHEPLVRVHLAWAIGRHADRAQLRRLDALRHAEEDALVLEELDWAIANIEASFADGDVALEPSEMTR